MAFEDHIMLQQWMDGPGLGSLYLFFAASEMISMFSFFGAWVYQHPVNCILEIDIVLVP